LGGGDGANPKGMPLGNLTSQFFANVYLNELDYFVKHKLKAKYYTRYVDDFVILHTSKDILENYQDKIGIFLKENLDIYLHHGKTKVIPLYKGISLLGFRAFYYHRLLKKKNLRRFHAILKNRKQKLQSGTLKHGDFINGLNGWLGYAMWANTHKLRKNILNQLPIEK
jgi:RNA-directed DNA polymerase